MFVRLCFCLNLISYLASLPFTVLQSINICLFRHLLIVPGSSLLNRWNGRFDSGSQNATEIDFEALGYGAGKSMMGAGRDRTKFSPLVVFLAPFSLLSHWALFSLVFLSFSCLFVCFCLFFQSPANPGRNRRTKRVPFLRIEKKRK